MINTYFKGSLVESLLDFGKHEGTEVATSDKDKLRDKGKPSLPEGIVQLITTWI